MKNLQLKNLQIEEKDGFERWLNGKIQNRRRPLDTRQQQSTTYQIPVVIHVIHNGEPEGNGSNISDEQILSQIAVLNEDYKRLNVDAANTPSEFLPVAGSLDIEFVMAKRTPEGLATNGIVRVQGSQTSWSINDNYELKSQSYWPAEDYMNIWVTNLGSSYVGYAQFPVSTLPGLENSSNNRLTDGVVIDHTAFGTIDAGNFDLDPQYNKGRTATHEIAHFLGLRHIWGDDEDESDKCAGTDYVDDTPNQQISTSGCPTTPRTSCNSNSMYMNYLDYTNDACMNIFTLGQVNRMVVVLENSPRRASLLTSPGLLEPAPVANDLGIRTIINPGATICSSSEAPILEIKNYGSNIITTSQIRFSRNGTPVETRNFVLNLAPQQTDQVAFSSLGFSEGDHVLSFEILLTNSTTDGNSSDNVLGMTTHRNSSINLPFAENFNVVPSTWKIDNPDQLTAWAIKTAPNETPGNTAMFMDFYNYEDRYGEIDALITPVFDLSSVPSAYLVFDVAYAVFPGNSDGLRVTVLNNCQSLAEGTTIYEKAGSELTTIPSTSVPFTPTDNSQWRKEIVDLTPFLGNSNVQLAFIGINDWGNNLYLDNISLITTAQEDLVLKSIESPTPVRCENNVIPQLKVQNGGTIAITSFTVDVTLNQSSSQSYEINAPLQPGEETTLSLPEVNLLDGSNQISFTLSEPNGLIDINPADNSRSTLTIVNDERDIIPLRENFDHTYSWLKINPAEGATWEDIATNYNNSIYFNSFENSVFGDESWLVSPVVDFSNTTTASLFFDVSYAFNEPHYEQLRIVTSKDCGNTFDVVSFSEGGDDLAVTTSSAPWQPSDTTEWIRKYVILNDLAGEGNVRVAFVVTNANGNNMYLDNIEFFTSDDPDPYPIDNLYLIYGTSPEDPGNFYITFNLPESQTVGYEIVDTMGRQIVSEQIESVLNQTYLIDAGYVATGIYIVRLKIGSEYHATKVFLEN